ncbi:MAG: hypothetical protein B7Z55_17595, partial [Planctomycetales bacterium 12-60-4]
MSTANSKLTAVHLRWQPWAVAVAGVLIWSCCEQVALADIHHAQGEMAGEVTSTSSLLQSRLTAIPGPTLDDNGDVPGIAGVACFEWCETDGCSTPERTEWLHATADSDYIVRAVLTGLRPGQRYYYRLVYGPDREHTQTGPQRQFRTLPAVTADEPLSFCMGS